MEAAKMAVNPPMAATTRIAFQGTRYSMTCPATEGSGRYSWGYVGTRNRKLLATRKTPAFTIVAAWMRALTGVGPSMASGSQKCSGNCADFPTAPPKRSRARRPRSSGVTLPASPSAGISSRIFSNSNVPKIAKMAITPTRNSRSPMRVTMKAFLAALAASGLWYQKPMRRYEQRPMISQKMRSCRKLSALTVPSIPVTKSAISAKNRGFPSSCAMYPTLYVAMRMARNETSVSMTRLRLSNCMRNAISPWSVTLGPGSTSTPGTHTTRGACCVSNVPPIIPPWSPVTRRRRETANAATKEPTTTHPQYSLNHRPKSPTTRNARSGAARMIHPSSNTSPPQEPDAVELDRAARLEQRQEDRHPDGRLRRRHGDREEGEDLAARVVRVGGEGDEVHHRGVEEDLDGHQDDDRVAPLHDPPEADAEEEGGERQFVLRGGHERSSFAR